MKFPLSLTTSLSAYLFWNRMSGRDHFPLVLMLEPLHACNLTCAGCGRIREYRETIHKTMSLDECLGVAEECGAPIVSVCGGEPLIYPQIAELVRGLIRQGRHVYLCTNGVLLRRKIAEFKPSSRLILNLHIDGQEQTHDRIVGRAGTFREAMEGIEEAHRLGFRITTNTTLCRQSRLGEVEGLFTRLLAAGVGSFLISPAYSYDSVEDRGYFMSRDEIRKQFQEALPMLARFPIANTPVYLEFLRGNRELPCTPWANPTRNPLGWRSPCYLLMDQHYATFDDLIAKTDWSAYGPGRDARCANCLVHSGFEASAALGLGLQRGDLLRMAAWQFR